jgi:predicted dehydrogenase
VEDFMAEIGFGIVGLDHWYTALPALDALRSTPGVQAVALAHRDAARAAAIGGRYDVPVLPSYGDVIGRADVDVVCVFTSTDENAALALRAIAAGKAVVAIKPLAMDLDEADQLVAAVQQSGAIYFPTEGARRLMPSYRRIKGWIDDGRIGRPLFVHNVFRAALPHGWPEEDAPGWWAEAGRAPGGAFLDHAIYHVDLTRWYCGSEVASIQGMTANVRYPREQIAFEDYGHAVLRLASGAMASIEDTWTSAPAAPKEAIEIVGESGAIILDSASGLLSVTGDFAESIPRAWLHTAPPAVRSSWVEHIARCVRGEEQLVSSVVDARANLAACLAFYESARTGAPVAPAAAR